MKDWPQKTQKNTKMDDEKIRQHLGFWLGDTCNRYLNSLLEIGILDESKIAENKKNILEAKEALLAEWTPKYWEYLQQMMGEKN